MHDKQFQFNELLLRLIEGDLTDTQQQELNQRIIEDPEFVEHYWDFVELYSELSPYGDISSPQKHDNSENDYDLMMEILGREEKLAPAVEIPEKKPARELIQNVVYPPKERRQLSRFSIASLLFSAAAVLCVTLFLQFGPSPKGIEVATLLDSINVKWAESSTPIHVGERFTTNTEPVCLLKGIVEIACDNDVEVVLEAPAQFKFITPTEIKVDYGRLWAQVSETGRGFTVVTNNSRIIDLGTEFGVNAALDGNTEIHVFKGKTTLISGTQKEKKAVMDVTAGQAKQVSWDNLQVSDIHLKEHFFVQGINSKEGIVWRGEDIDLADIICGGNGFGSGNKDFGIHPLTGQIEPERILYSEEQDAKGQFIEVMDSDFVDSVFAPDGQPDYTNQISTTGLSFDGFPDTTREIWCYFTGQPYYMNHELYGSQGLFDNGRENRSIYIHSNMGITIDLEKIRGQFRGQVDIQSFKAMYGFRNQGFWQDNKIDFWILVDGQCVLKKLNFQYTQHLKPFEIPLKLTDRFLTLAITQAEDDMHNDWAVFVEPKLVLENINN